MTGHPGAAAGPGMRVLLASEPGAAERPNEDFAAAVPGAVVLLDGAGYVPDAGTGCVHGVAWYVRTLGSLLAVGAGDGRVPLPELLSRGIEQVSRMHAGTCDLRHPATPSATVIVARQRGGALEYLVLCDSVLLLQPARRAHRHHRHPAGPDHGQAPASRRPARRDARVRRGVAGLRAAARSRAQPAGRFLARRPDPGAAAHAITGSEPLDALSAAALLSDGASRLADRFHLATWAEMGGILAAEGPASLIRRVRAAEAGDPGGKRWPRSKIHDDATAVLWTMDAGPEPVLRILSGSSSAGAGYRIATSGEAG